jgi:type I restriction enzyme R subunit
MEGVQLGGVKLVPAMVGENYAVDPSDDEQPIGLPIFVGESRGEAAKPKGPLDEAIEKVNEMFSTKGIDASPTSIEGFITAYWGFLDANDEAVAMAKSNTVEQLKGSTKFSDAVDNAMYQAFQASDEIKKTLADTDVLRQLAAISAETLHAQHHNSAEGDDDAGQ